MREEEESQGAVGPAEELKDAGAPRLRVMSKQKKTKQTKQNKQNKTNKSNKTKQTIYNGGGPSSFLRLFQTF